MPLYFDSWKTQCIYVILYTSIKVYQEFEEDLDRILKNGIAGSLHQRIWREVDIIS